MSTRGSGSPPARKETSFEQFLHHGVEAPRADVLDALVHCPGDLGNPPHTVGGEFEFHPVGGQQRPVLLHQARLGLGEDAHEVVHCEAVELDPDGEAALQLGDEVARLAQVERARSDEEDVIGAHHTVLGGHGGAFHQRQQVALHPWRETSAPEVS